MAGISDVTDGENNVDSAQERKKVTELKKERIINGHGKQIAILTVKIEK